jgi:hypothetical protein
MKDKTDPSEGAAKDCEIEELKGGPIHLMKGGF